MCGWWVGEGVRALAACAAGVQRCNTAAPRTTLTRPQVCEGQPPRAVGAQRRVVARDGEVLQRQLHGGQPTKGGSLGGARQLHHQVA